MRALSFAGAIGGRLTPVLICAAAVLAIGLAADKTRDAQAGNGPTLSIDMDITNGGGACATIDATANASSGSLNVGVCLTGNPGTSPIATIGYRVRYDDTVLQAPEEADLAPNLDDNPDANVGTTTFTSATYPNHLGDGWDCAGGVGAQPVGDEIAATGSGNGLAFSGGCGSAAGPTSGGSPGLLNGPLGIIRFTVLSSSSTTLAIEQAVINDDNLEEVGSCNPTVFVSMTCVGGTLNPGAPTNTPVPPTNTPGPATATSTAGIPTSIFARTTLTPTPTPEGSATAPPAGTEVPPPPPPPPPGASPTRTGQPGVGVTGPDTGSGPGGGSGFGANLLLLAASGAVFVAAGAATAWRKRHSKTSV